MEKVWMNRIRRENDCGGKNFLLLFHQAVIGSMGLYVLWRDGIVLRNVMDIVVSMIFHILLFAAALKDRGKHGVFRQFCWLTAAITFYFQFKNVFEQNRYLLLGLMSLLQLGIFLFLLSYLLQDVYLRRVQLLCWVLAWYLIIFPGIFFFSKKAYSGFYLTIEMGFYFLPFLVLVLNRKVFSKYGKLLRYRMLQVAILCLFALLEAVIVKVHRIYVEHDLDFDLYLMILTGVLMWMMFCDLRITGREIRQLLGNDLPGTKIAGILILCCTGICIFQENLAAGAAALGGCLMLQYSAGRELAVQEEMIQTGEIPKERKEPWIVQNLIQFRSEQEKEESFGEFLHDEILQDILFLKNVLDSREQDPKVGQALERVIRNIRNQMDTCVPLIPGKVPLKKTYSNVIRMVRERYPETGTFVEFYCDGELFLLAPYDVLIYRAIKELVTNVYKHTEAEEISVTLKVEEQIIYLTVVNDGEPFRTEQIAGLHRQSGLKSIERDVVRLGGTFDIGPGEKNGTCAAVMVPIKEEIVDENFISRRS